MKGLKNIKEINGITLIALVITIVVLIILASVAITMSLNNNGLFSRAKQAKNDYINAEAFENDKIEELAKLLGNRGDIEVGQCTLTVSDYAEAEISGVENLYGFIMVRDNEAVEITKGEKCNLQPIPDDVTQKYYAYAVDKSGKLYKSNEVTKNRNASYIQDGLILYLDGIKNSSTGHSDEITSWYDLASNHNSATLYNCTNDENSIIFNGSNSYASLPVGALGEDGETTIEVVMKSDATGCQPLILDTTANSHRGIGIEGEKKFSVYTVKPGGAGVNGYMQVSKSVTNIQYVSAVFDGINYENTKLYQDSILCEDETSDKHSFANSSTYPIIGKRIAGSGYANYMFKGKIYAIRVYNRILTDAEILQNYNTDKARFGIQ